ncbi:beta-ketoacyl synthase [Lacinutrix sp. 5H-3-7-4]|uniref:beta-ketoacyl-[acyl-carrier-protein] synthase family protein n=1 Tax=Lacinutrix sp. (strain 5H-3-7-4) TaxID=983544 RepID=UPI00020A3D0F|nr:beta-ketoacyl synthase N-terminal-like domain-containing protein [Lacinutrix sp. 5H-3-7-4]AEH01928.1 Beta-ketoacyl-acyl-carrier-protein synthase I [Lacinutrix sp. 5H-3-7-4]
MSNIYVSYNNITSSLGFDSETVVQAISEEKSGLKLVDDKAILPNNFYSSLINREALKREFLKQQPKGEFTHLEKMMISSLSKVVKASNLEINDKVGLIISTTKGNIDALDEHSIFNKSRAYLSALGNTLKTFFNFKNEPVIVSNACVSGVLSVAIAKRFIQQEKYDHVFIVGGDIVTAFILSGFNSFQALSNAPCKPFDKNRTGINIGEVATSVLVTKDKNKLSKDAVEVLGESSCNDANHISGPSRTGEGLYRSIILALKQAKITHKDIDYISAHGTATLFNDEMEAIAFNRSGLSHVPINSLKGYFGHTLGASGLLETIVGMHSLYNNTLYKSLGFSELGVSKALNVISKTQKKPLKTFLKTASGFGGCNTAVIFKKV